MSKCIIHVGMPKAASSFIKRRYFSDLNLIVPRGKLVERIKNGQITLDELLERANVPNSSSNSNIDNLIISNEDLIGDGFWSCANMRTYFKNIYRLNNEAHVLIIFRNQAKYIASAYKYCIHKGIPLSPLQKHLSRNKQGLSSRLNYFDILTAAQEFFPKEQVHVVLQEQLETESDSVDVRMMDLLGLESSTFNQIEEFNKGQITWSDVERQRLSNYISWPAHYLTRKLNSSRRNNLTTIEKTVSSRSGSIANSTPIKVLSASLNRDFCATDFNNIIDAFIAELDVANSNSMLEEALGTNLSQYGYLVAT